ncbi:MULTISPECIES: hypothetical protein [unclassified Mesorhizobium]|uniref:hypothetical protein n=1 Tax=unclassified Mesorhizobium TaxID=325217 RepID=UPI001937B671|nr:MULTISPECIES: hypothetical protein [unclassified Mesorhizobium]BCG82871.1 hypothetical protein MesoLj113b_64130 [Mesorhizobium sp. 113-3-3]BCG90748.1 hypothetical protein MesoLj113c_68580 [Mesorhizobium sp. 113-3-9]
MNRPSDLQHFLDTAELAMCFSQRPVEERCVVQRVIAKCRNWTGEIHSAGDFRLPVMTHFDETIARRAAVPPTWLMLLTRYAG